MVVDVVVVDVEGRDRAVSASHPHRLLYEYFTGISPTYIFTPLLIAVPIASWISSISVKISFNQPTGCSRPAQCHRYCGILPSIVQWRSRNYLQNLEATLSADMHAATTVYFPTVTPSICARRAQHRACWWDGLNTLSICEYYTL